MAQEFAGERHDVPVVNIPMPFRKHVAICLSRLNRAKPIFPLLPALRGNALAQFNLANLYESGQGVPKDFAEAVRWYRKAAEQGAAPAEYALGGCYADGLGVPQDLHYKDPTGRPVPMNDGGKPIAELV